MGYNKAMDKWNSQTFNVTWNPGPNGYLTGSISPSEPNSSIYINPGSDNYTIIQGGSFTWFSHIKLDNLQIDSQFNVFSWGSHDNSTGIRYDSGEIFITLASKGEGNPHVERYNFSENLWTSWKRLFVSVDLTECEITVQENSINIANSTFCNSNLTVDTDHKVLLLATCFIYIYIYQLNV